MYIMSDTKVLFHRISDGKTGIDERGWQPSNYALLVSGECCEMALLGVGEQRALNGSIFVELCRYLAVSRVRREFKERGIDFKIEFKKYGTDSYPEVSHKWVAFALNLTQEDLKKFDVVVLAIAAKYEVKITNNTATWTKSDMPERARRYVRDWCSQWGEHKDVAKEFYPRVRENWRLSRIVGDLRKKIQTLRESIHDISSGWQKLPEAIALKEAGDDEKYGAFIVKYGDDLKTDARYVQLGQDFQNARKEFYVQREKQIRYNIATADLLRARCSEHSNCALQQRARSLIEIETP